MHEELPLSSAPSTKPSVAETLRAATTAQQVLIALLLALAFTLAFREIRDLDTGFHLKAGDWMLQNFRWPGNDVFTYTINDHPYIDMYWGYQVVLSITNSIGGEFLIVAINALLVVLNFWLVIKRTQQLGSIRQFSFGVVMFVGVFAASYHFGIRPHIFSFLFLNLILLVLENYYRDRSTKLWPLPVIMLLWVNMHTIFVLGWVAFFCYFVGISIEQRKLDMNLLKWCAIGVMICLLNPYTYHCFLLPLEQFGFLQGGNLFKKMISEYASPFKGRTLTGMYWLNGELVLFQPNFFFHLFLVLTLIAVGARLLKEKIVKIHELLLVVIFSYLMASAFKNIGYFLMALMPLVVHGIGALFYRHRDRLTPAGTRLRDALPTTLTSEKMLLWGSVGMIVVVVLASMRVATNAYYIGWRSRDVTGYRYSTNNMPMRSAQFLRDNGLTGRLFNHINFGGIYMYMLPQKVFIDARNEVIGEEFFKEFSSFRTPKGREAILRKYDPQIIAFPRRVEERYWLPPLRKSPDWRLVYLDDISMVFLKKDYAPQILALDSNKAAEGAPARSLQEIDEIIYQYKPTSLFSGFFKPQYFPNEEMDVVGGMLAMRWIEPAIRYGVEGIRRSTVDVPEMYYNLAEAFRLRGDWERAIYCYRRYHTANPTAESAKKIRYCQQMAIGQQRGMGNEQPPAAIPEENADTTSSNQLDQ
ncbi:MAG: hypothetical protein DYG96_11870 [Chlorobi bacterium CHB2]|nr:hypothetical protein [Chlorobi bacterium CHB2]